jgi:hypothetical protein
VKIARDKLRQVLESEGEIKKLVICFQRRGQKPEALHSFENNTQAITFAAETLRLSDSEWVDVLRGR